MLTMYKMTEFLDLYVFICVEFESEVKNCISCLFPPDASILYPLNCVVITAQTLRARSNFENLNHLELD